MVARMERKMGQNWDIIVIKINTDSKNCFIVCKNRFEKRFVNLVDLQNDL